MKRILVIQLKRIGDFILTVPALGCLRRAFPNAEIVLVVPRITADLARCVPAANRIIAYTNGALNLEAWTSALAGPWDACLDFCGTDRSALLAKLSRAKRRIGYAKFAGKGLRRLAYTKLCDASVRDLHTISFHEKLIQEVTTDHSSRDPECTALLVPGQAIVNHAQARLAAAGVSGRFAIVHPGTAREDKFWLDERWAEVCRALHEEHHLTVVLTGTGDGLEKPHLTALKKHLRVPVADLTGQCSLPELFVMIREAAVVIGVDSMAMHLAAVSATPQVALFGPVNPFHWRALHARSFVVMPGLDEPLENFSPKMKKSDVKLISTPAVLGAIRRALSHPFD